MARKLKAGKNPTKGARKIKKPEATTGNKNAKTATKQYHLPLPNTPVGRFFNKQVRFMPRYLREAVSELRQVTWPSRKETWKLTLAVFIFAIVFGLLIAVVDYGLDKLFKRLLLNS